MNKMKGKSVLNRINFRLKIKNITVFFMIARTQTASGITSRVGKNRHIILWDLDNCTLKQAEKTLREVQKKYNLSHIYIISDKEGSYRALCFSIVDFNALMKIIISANYVDEYFISYTAKRMKATLRLTKKINREKQDILSILYSYYEPMPVTIEKVIYDTGLIKHGITIGSID